MQHAGSVRDLARRTFPLAVALLVVLATSPSAQAVDPPDTTITSGPEHGALVLPGPVSYAFTSDQVPVDFECSVDNAAFTTCTSPATYDLPPGGHLFRVRAVNPEPQADPTPAERIWTVRNVACEQAGAQYAAAQSSFFKHHTRKGYAREKLQRAKQAGNQKLIEKYQAKIRKLNRQIKVDKAAMNAALAQEQAVC